MPSRVIINRVKKKTPANALAPSFAALSPSRVSISRLMCFACRHIWTISDATSTAAASARTPSQSA
jgi:hypothetical protein